MSQRFDCIDSALKTNTVLTCLNNPGPGGQGHIFTREAAVWVCGTNRSGHTITPVLRTLVWFLRNTPANSSQSNSQTQFSFDTCSLNHSDYNYGTSPHLNKSFQTHPGAKTWTQNIGGRCMAHVGQQNNPKRSLPLHLPVRLKMKRIANCHYPQLQSWNMVPLPLHTQKKIDLDLNLWLLIDPELLL